MGNHPLFAMVGMICLVCFLTFTAFAVFALFLGWLDEQGWLDGGGSDTYDPNSLDAYLDDPSHTPMSNKWKLGDWDDRE